MRKYRCVFIGAFQEPSQVDDFDPALTDLLLGQCKYCIEVVRPKIPPFLTLQLMGPGQGRE
jgi:hypothetical protein